MPSLNELPALILSGAYKLVQGGKLLMIVLSDRNKTFFRHEIHSVHRRRKDL